MLMNKSRLNRKGARFFGLFISNRHTFVRSSDNQNQLKRGRLWRISKAQKLVIAGMIIAMLIVSAFGFLMDTNSSEPNAEPISYEPTASPSPSPTAEPTARPTSSATPRPIPTIAAQIYQGWQQVITPAKKGLIEAADSMNSTVWKDVAKNAWDFFTPGRGVDPTTGLPASSFGWNYFTDWDLGVYIQAVIDAQKIGLITKDGEWGSSERLEKVVTFLETRSLNVTTGVPFWFYKSSGEGYLTQSAIDGVDAGTLFVALSNLKEFNASLTNRIDNFVYNAFNNRTNYAVLLPGIKSESLYSTNIYAYYLASGFASFFPEVADAPEKILSNIQAAGFVKDSYNSTLPRASISCEPLLYAIFNLESNSYLDKIMNMTYLAHEVKYLATGEYVAFSEGNSYSTFIYEWVVLSNGETWKIMNAGESSYSNSKPIIYQKVALSFLALYNTTFAKDMCIYIEKNSVDPLKGYICGVEFNTNDYARAVEIIDSNTNGLIISAACYALNT